MPNASRFPIKQLAVARRRGSAVQVFVAPALVSGDNFLAGVDGATDAISFAGKSSSSGRGRQDQDYVLVGPGAGGGPTAVAVLGDVCELARGTRKFSGAPESDHQGTLKLPTLEDEIDVIFLSTSIIGSPA